MRNLIQVGAWVSLAGRTRAVLTLSAESIRLTDGAGPPRELPLSVVLEAEDFEVLTSELRMPLPPQPLLDTIPEQAREKALWWEPHILEVLHGTAPGAHPRPEYDPARVSLTTREQTKAAELTAEGHRVGMSTVGHLRRRYQTEGLLGLVDRRQKRLRP
ncbi:hypothetical protein [Streptomyces sp. NPDC048419]|uniref:hypothetical protein n=1 Tax=Streptomyces sp. NPDC048419 TaxID=3365547 RepID=UPI00371DB9A7